MRLFSADFEVIRKVVEEGSSSGGGRGLRHSTLLSQPSSGIIEGRFTLVY